jgi:hypothetical protein
MSRYTSNLTSGFIDLATYDELEKYLYGCKTCVSYFVRTTVKSSWFTQLPVILPLAKGQADFGNEFSVNISRAGDYLLHTWLRVALPNVSAITGNVANLRLRWVQNLMHNLVKEVSITCNDLVVAKFDSFHLDMWAAFTVPAGKQAGYNEMVGNIRNLIDLTDSPTGAPAAGQNFQLPPSKINPGIASGNLTAGQPTEIWLNLPLPFFYSRDTGLALPTAALPYTDMSINFSFRNWDELLIGETPTNSSNTEFRRVPTVADLGSHTEAPTLSNVEVWANYAIVSNDERKRMACSPRDILIEQVQIVQPVVYTPTSNPNPRIDLRLSHAIKVLFFAVRNSTFASERSVYTVGSPLMGNLAVVAAKFHSQYAEDPVDTVSVVYENTARLANMGADYYSLVNPYFHAPSIPAVSGFHCYSYSLDFMCSDPMGSTNYGKLSNVSIMPIASTLAIAANSLLAGSTTTLPLTGGAAEPPGGANGSGVNIRQTYEFYLSCINNNIVRISGGTIGFPVL